MSSVLDILSSYGYEVDKSNKLCCPLHGEKTPSFVVYEETDSWHCFGCSSGGDAIEFIIQYEEFDKETEFHKAVKIYESVVSDGRYIREEDIVAKEFNDDVLNHLKSITTFDSGGYRGIRTDISKQYGVMYELKDGDVYKSYYPTSKNSSGGRINLSGFKVREHPKTFREHYGETGRDCELFGQWKFQDSDSDTIVLCSGEHDALAAYQMLSDNTAQYNKRSNSNFKPTPCVAPTVGEGGLLTQVKNNYDFLNKFKKILFVPDKDKTGDKVTKDLFESLPKDKLFIVNIDGAKDPNQLLEEGRQRDFINAYFKAGKYIPTGVIGSGGLMSKVIEHAMLPKIPLPPFMHRLEDDMAGGIPLGVIINAGGGSGIGKSTIIDEMIYYWIFNSPYKVGILSLESDEGEYGTKILSRHLGRKINLIKDVDEKVAFLSSEEVIRKSEVLFKDDNGNDRFYLIDDRDGSINDIKEAIMKLVIQLECKYIIIDPLQDLIASLPDSEQNEFMSWMKGVIASHHVSFCNVNHTRKDDQSAKNRSGDFLLDYVSEHDFHGSSSIYKSGACNILLARNKEAECPIEKNTTYAKASKIRWTGITSRCSGKYYYDIHSHTLYDYDDYWTPEKKQEHEESTREVVNF